MEEYKSGRYHDCKWLRRIRRVSMVPRLPVLGGALIPEFGRLRETTGLLKASSTTDGRGPGEDSTKTGDPGGVGFPNFLGIEKHESTKPYIDACGFSRRQRRIIMHLTLMVVSQCPLTTCLDSSL